MKISFNSYSCQNLLFRYSLSSNLLASAKTQNPNILHTVIFSKSVYSISSVCNSSSGPSSISCSDSYLLQKKQSLVTCSSGPASKCIRVPYRPSKNRFLSSFSSWSSSRFNFEPLSLHKQQPLYYSSSGYSHGICSLARSCFQSLGSATLFKHNCCCLSARSRYYRFGSLCRCFITSISGGTVIPSPAEESEVHSMDNVFSEQQKLEGNRTFPGKFILDVIDNVRINGKDLESRLSVLAPRLSVYAITEIFEVLNCQRISGVRFFKWIWTNIPHLHKSARLCSLIIDNCGRLDDYETMLVLLQELTSKNICLTYEAFGVLPVLASDSSSLREPTKTVVDLLNKVGGSCRSSGVCALVEMFCKLDLFEMANYVINVTESKESYYHNLVREKCRRGLVDDARGIIIEMRGANCVPDTTVYNYMLGSLCKNGRKDEASVLLDEMKEMGVPSDAITFEILINFECRLGKMDLVENFLEQMVVLGLEPRLETHMAIVKSLFSSAKYEEAHKYVVDTSVVYKTSSNVMYSLLANLYREQGDIMSAQNTLVEMMEKSLKPNFNIYVKIVKQLKRIWRGNLARNLEGRHSKFVIKSPL